jgi:hypothetical protein
VGPAALAQILGDRSMKIRYLSPNLLLLVTGYPAGMELPAEERDFVAANMCARCTA